MSNHTKRTEPVQPHPGTVADEHITDDEYRLMVDAYHQAVDEHRQEHLGSNAYRSETWLDAVERQMFDACETVIGQGVPRNDVYRVAYWAEALGRCKGELAAADEVAS